MMPRLVTSTITDNSTNGNGGAAATNGSNAINFGGGIPAGGPVDGVVPYGTNVAQGTDNNAQQGDTNFNANLAGSTGTNPIQMRDTSADDSAVAMDEGFAQNVKDQGTNAQDSGLAQGGRDNVNVIVTDPALQFGHNNSYANGNGSLAVSADAATTGAGSAMDNSNGGMGAMDQGVAQGGQVNVNGTPSTSRALPIQVRNMNDNDGMIANDEGTNNI